MPVKFRYLGFLACVLQISIVGLCAPRADLRVLEAAKQGEQETITSLLKQHPDVNASEPDGSTALLWASYRDDLNTADLLIRAGSNVNAATDYGVTPLSMACTNGS